MKTMLFATSLLTLIACGGSDRDHTGGDGLGGDLETPSGLSESALVGAWFTGTLSSIQYYDRYNHQWQDPSGAGFYVIFKEDGAYETGAVIDSTVGNCTMRLLGTEVGTVTDQGHELTVYRHWIRTSATNTCGNGGEREQGPKVSKLGWAIGYDSNQRPLLTLTDPEYGPTTYAPWQNAE